MFNKSFTFGLLAAGLMIAPGAAFAQQTAISEQDQNQTAVVGGAYNTVVQHGVQSGKINQYILDEKGYSCKSITPQTAVNAQNQNQTAVVGGKFNTVAQLGNQTSKIAQTNICH
ncbi:MAG: hypothetical protein QNJ47_25935 [Nostocaceae cyanobacterium]|nr:hypothetical protein [Nostocaceae cyanobacterium]